jgi:uncharacterized protein YjbJ (UPF0337 family)
MNKDQIWGKVENIKGRIKEAMGTATGDKRAEGEGLAERVKGAFHKTVGDLKHAISEHDDADKKEARRDGEFDDEETRRG